MGKEECTHNSPTTPGLKVPFRKYVIELVCLNVNPRIGPRFWQDQKYWGPKYRREIKGIYNLKLRFGDLDNPILQNCIVGIVRDLRIKSLSATKTIDKLERISRKRYRDKLVELKQLKKRLPSKIEYIPSDDDFVDAGDKTKLSKIKDLKDSVTTQTEKD